MVKQHGEEAKAKGTKLDSRNPEGQQDCQGRAHGGAGGYAQKGRIYQGIAKDGLVAGAGDCQRRADHKGCQDPRQADIEEHGLLDIIGGRAGRKNVPPQEAYQVVQRYRITPGA